MNKYYFHLKDVPHPLTPKGDEWLYRLPETCHVEIPRRYFSHTYEEWLHKFDLNLWNGEVFCRPKNSMLGIHIDGEKLYDKGKMNWAWCDGEHYNTWYKIKEGVIKEPIREQQTDGKISNYFHLFDLHEVDEVDRTTLMNPTIVASGIPHSVITTTHPRRSVSITMIPKNYKFEDEDWGMPMSELEQIFREHIK